MKFSRRKLAKYLLALTWLMTTPEREVYAALFSGAPIGGAVAITTFSIVNSSGSTSKCRYRRGLAFNKGDIPSGSVPVITQGATTITAQFDERNFWSDGSLKLCVLHMMDTDFSGSESRTYTISKQTGSYNNTSLRTLADVTGAHTFQVTFNTVTNYLNATYGSGAFTADFTTQSGVATRVYQYHSGPVCTSWEVWGMATDNSGGAPDAHLKTIWYVTAWNNPNGTLYDIEYGAVVALDWWSVASKTLLNYNALLKDGASTINTYSSVVHPYQAQWMTVRTNNDDNHARRYWATAIPTLYHTFDKAYARSTGLFPYLNPTAIPNSSATEGFTANYVPGSAENQRPNIDGVGGYMARGAMPQTDCIAWMRQTSTDYRYARTSAFGGLHVPYHYRSNDSRTISSGPQAGTDTANTIISMIMRPLSPPSYDFTAQGMPAAIDAYTGNCVSPITATYVTPNGGPGPIWNPSTDASHAVAYCYGMYLLEGERHFMQATLDLAMNCTHQQRGNTFGGAPQAMYSGQSPFQTLLSIPATQYSGIGGQFPELNNQRNVGWAAMVVAYGNVVCPAADVQSGFITLFRVQMAAYTVFSTTYMPATQKTLGVYGFLSSGGLGGFLNPPWMDNFGCLGHAINAKINEDPNSLSVLNSVFQYSALAPWENGTQNYRSDDYREITCLFSQTPYDPSTNPYLARAACCEQAQVVSVSNVMTIATDIAPTNGDVVYFIKTDDSFNSIAIPTGTTEGTQYFAVNCSGLTMKVSATMGGSALSIPDGTYSIARQPSLWSTTPLQNPPFVPGGADATDNYMFISNATMITAAKAGANAITPTMLSRGQTFCAPLIDPASPSFDATFPNWTYLN